MESKRGKSALVLMMSVLLLVLAVGSVAPGAAQRIAVPQVGAVEAGDELQARWLCPHAGGSSGA